MTDIYTWFASIIDNKNSFQNEHPSSSTCILDYFNKAPINYLCDELYLKNIVTECTRKNSLLDVSLISNANKYYSIVKAPLSNSDHNDAFVFKETPQAVQFKTHTFFDFNLMQHWQNISDVNWNNMFKLANINEKVNFYNEPIKKCMTKILVQKVKMTTQNNEWITPICTNLINLRWKTILFFLTTRENSNMKLVRQENLVSKMQR